MCIVCRPSLTIDLTIVYVAFTHPCFYLFYFLLLYSTLHLWTWNLYAESEKNLYYYVTN